MNIIDLIIFILAVIGAGLAWKTPSGWICLAIAAIELIALLPGGPW